MTATIAYDRPVKNLIDALSATKHVTHTTHRKTSVTFHHNAGRLSHDGVLRVWQVRPASAHFNVDAAGTVCQYVKVNEYAWATGNSEGNRSSISIEMCNKELSPTWEVSETTWKNAARLGGWLFARVIGAAPTASNVHFHSHWRATACAGPWMDKKEAELLAEVKKWYAYFTAAPTPAPTKPAPTTSVATLALGSRGIAVERLQREMRRVFPSYASLTPDGRFGPKTEAAVKEFQRRTGLVRDGRVGPATRRKMASYGLRLL